MVFIHLCVIVLWAKVICLSIGRVKSFQEIVVWIYNIFHNNLGGSELFLKMLEREF